VGLFGGLETGLEALLKVGYAIASYAWVGIDSDAHATVSHPLTRLTYQYPQLLPPEAIRDWDSRLPMDVRTDSMKLFAETFSEGVDLLLSSPPTLAKHSPMIHRDHGPYGPMIIVHRIVKLILYLTESQLRG
jgi:hypothetical protein